MNEQNPPTEAPEAKPKKKFLPFIGIGVILVGAFFGFRQYQWSKTHEGTEDAQVSSNMSIVSPLVSGLVKEIAVEDNAEVKKGDVLLTLDASRLEAAVNQAKANLEAAQADAEAAGISVDLTAAKASASQTSAAGGVDEASAAISSSQVGIAAANAALNTARANAKAADSNLENAVLDQKSAEAVLNQRQSGAASAEAMLEAAKAQIETAKSMVRAAENDRDLARKNLARAQSLYKEGGISKQELDQTQSRENATESAVDSARSQLSTAEALVKQRTSELASARSLVQQATTQLARSKGSIEVARQLANAAHSAGDVAKLQISSAEASLRSAAARRTTSLGNQSSSQASNLDVKRMSATSRLAFAKVEQAKAALASAQFDLDHATVKAPFDGRISKRLVEVGSMAQVGSPLFYLIPEKSIFVVANFKETQTSKMHEGSEAEIEIDGIPGEHFKGKIVSMSPGTGSSFALLPPDNATGNFVKVVQRIPVKIAFDDPAVMKKLKVGMSANVTIEVK